MFDRRPFVACARRPAGARGWATDNRGLSDWFSRTGSIFKETRLHIQHGWERDNGVCVFPTAKSPQRNNQNAAACVVRYVACGNLKHTLKVEKRSNPQPRGRADPERQVSSVQPWGRPLAARASPASRARPGASSARPGRGQWGAGEPERAEALGASGPRGNSFSCLPLAPSYRTRCGSPRPTPESLLWEKLCVLKH
jgi:hypothetical protein